MQESTAVVPRKLRRRLEETACAKWLVPLLRCIALPVADSRKRFLVPLCVLTLLLPLLICQFRSVDPLEGGLLSCRIQQDTEAGQDWEDLLSAFHHPPARILSDISNLQSGLKKREIS